MFKKICTLMALSVLLLTVIYHQSANAAFGLKSENENTTYKYTLSPGEKVSGNVIVFSTTKAQKVKIYAGDGTLTNQGSLALYGSSHKNTAIGSWMTFKNDILDLKVNDSLSVPFEILIPKSAVPGTYAGAIAIESIPEKLTTGGSGVITISRVILPVYIEIPGKKLYDFEWKNFTYDELNKTFTVNIRNKGNTIVNLSGAIEIKSAFSKANDPKVILPVSAIQLLQNETISIPIQWESDTIYGQYTAAANITFSEFDLHSGQNINTLTYNKTLNITVIPWTYIYYGIALIVLILAIILLLKIRTRKLASKASNYVIKQGDTLENLAKKNNLNWKLIAKINRLKAPYSLSVGSKILLPTSSKK